MIPDNQQSVKPKTLDEFLNLFKGVKPGKDGWYQALCPAHDDNNASLGIREDSGKIGLNCLAGCTAEAITRAVGLELKDLYLDKAVGKPQKRIVKIYKYTNFEVVRTDPKGFFQRRPDGKGGYINSVKGINLTLYHDDRLPLAIADKKPVFFVEGEKDVESLEAIGLIATTSPMGANKFHNYYAESVKGADLVIIPDNDKPGKDGKIAGLEHAKDVARKCYDKAARIRLLYLQGGKDATDWINLGHTGAELLQLASLCPDYQPPLPENASPEATESPLDDTLHDVGNAKRLIAKYGHKIRYNYERKKWLIYNGKYWAWDEGGEIVNLARNTSKSIYHEAAEAPNTTKAEALADHAKASQSNSRINAMVSLAQSDVSVTIADLNSNPYLLNVNNGTINLKTGELQPHNPDDLITQFIPIDYIPDAKGARFETFLNEVFEANQDLIGYVQRALGYSLTGDQSEQALFFNKGAGFNGKSTLYGIVGDILADYADEIDPLAFMVDKNAHVGPNESLANLYGKRFVTSVEVKAAMRLNVALVKRMTGGEMIRCERKFEHGFNFKPTHKLFILGNAEPRIDDNTNSIWYRLKYINFAVTFPEEKRDRKLREYIVKNESPAVLAWMVAGCLDWLKDGLREPQSIKEAVSAYRDSQDILHEFFFEKCVVGISENDLVSDVYKSYGEWENENGNKKPLGKKAFGDLLKERGYFTQPGHGNKTYWHGFRLKTAIELVNLVNFGRQNQETFTNNLSCEKTSEKIANQINQINPDNQSNPPGISNELPDCPNCGQCNWTFNPDGSLHCETCGENK